MTKIAGPILPDLADPLVVATLAIHRHLADLEDARRSEISAATWRYVREAADRLEELLAAQPRPSRRVLVSAVDGGP